jgi:hypothetical protein
LYGASSGHPEEFVGDIFREVDEDLQRDRLKELWAKYNIALIAVAVALVAGTAGWEGWKTYTQRRDEANGQIYAEALLLADSGKAKEAAEAFAKIAQDAGAGYAALARLEQAALLAKQGDRAGAVAVYDALADDSGAGRSMRDLATLLSVEHADPKADPASLIQRLQPLTDASSPWRYAAIELSAALATRMGDMIRARSLYAQIADDNAAPAGLRARAAEMLAALKS